MLNPNDETFIKIKTILAKYTKRAYFVGGCVRDYYYQIPTNDYDIEIYDITSDEFSNIAKELNASGYGKSFFVYKLKNYDLALARAEIKTGIKHTDFKVFIENDEFKASLRRDFCMNAIMINIFNGEIKDYHNGIDDCNNKRINILHYKTFCEDSLRVLRFVQFIARFKLKPKKSDLEYLKQISIKNLSFERINLELEKLLNAQYIELGLYYLYKLDLFYDCFGVDINKAEFYYAISKLKQNKNIVIQDKIKGLFFYYLAKIKGISTKELLKHFKAKKELNFIHSELIIDKINEIKLCKIAIKMPLKEWLGLDKNSLKLSKKLKIYDKKIKVDYTGVNSQELALQSELKAIKEYLCLI